MMWLHSIWKNTEKSWKVKWKDFLLERKRMGCLCDYPFCLAEKFTSCSVSAYWVLMLWKNVTLFSSLYSVDWLALWCFMRITFFITYLSSGSRAPQLRPVGVWNHCLKFSCGTGLWCCSLCVRDWFRSISNTWFLSFINSHFCKYFLNRTKFDSVCLFIQKLSCFEQKNISFLRPSNNLTKLEKKRE